MHLKVTLKATKSWLNATVVALLGMSLAHAQQALPIGKPKILSQKVNSAQQKHVSKQKLAGKLEGVVPFGKNMLKARPELAMAFQKSSLPTTTSAHNGGGNTVLNTDTLIKYTFPNDQWPSTLQRFRRHNLAPASAVNYVNQAWVAATLTGYNGNYVARSTSWFNPVGTADDWMITPPITIDSNTYDLIWKAVAVDPQYPDGYEVRICENCPNITAQNALTVMNTVLFSIPAELAERDANNVPVFQNRRVRLTNYKNKTVRIAFRNNSNDMFLLDVDDIMVVRVADRDMQAIGVEGPSYPCGLGANESVRVRFKNGGLQTATDFTVSLLVNGNPAGSTVVSSLAAGAEGTFTFSGVNFTIPGDYTLTCIVTQTGDEIAGNNAFSTTYTVEAPINLNNGPYTTSFENTENLKTWITENKNNDSFTWFRFTSPGLGNNGDSYFAYPNNGTAQLPWPTVAGNDWLIGGCVTLQADTNYQISFFHNSSGDVLHNLSVKYGRKPVSDSITGNIVSFNAIPVNTTYQEKSAIFNVNTSGVYFIGFHITSPAGTGRFRLDDFKIRKSPQLDLSIDAITRPEDGGYLCGGNPETISFRASNQGTLPLTNAPVTILVESTGTPQLFNFTIPSLAPGASGNYTLTPGANFSFPTEYTITVTAAVPGDGDASNDSKSVTVEVFPAESAPIVDNFDDLQNFELPTNWYGVEFFALENHGKNSSVGITTNLYKDDPQFGTVDRAELITTKIDNITANTSLAFEYRFMNFSGYPNNPYTLQPGDSLLIQISNNCGNFVTIGSVSASNHSAQASFVRLLYPLSAYANAANISIRFLAKHGGGSGDYYIDIDNFQVREIAQFDAAIATPVRPPYSKTPIKHVTSFRPGVEISNDGVSDLGPLSLSATITPGGYNATANIGGLEAGSSALINFPTQFTPTAIGPYELSYSVQTSANQPDGDPSNNQATVEFDVTDTTFARDFGDSDPFGLGIGEGTRGMLGQVYQLQVVDTVTSLTFWTDLLPFGPTTVKPVIFQANASGVPTSAPLDTNFAAVVIDESMQTSWNTIDLRRPSQPANAKGRRLTAGRYLFGLMEKNNYMSLGFNSNVSQPQTSFFRLGFAAGNNWTPIASAIGDGQLFIRPNFRPVVQTSNTQIETSLRMTQLYPNPATGNVVNLDIRMHAPAQATVRISDILGKRLSEQSISLNKGTNVKELNVQDLQPGIYFVTVNINGTTATYKFLKQ